MAVSCARLWLPDVGAAEVFYGAVSDWKVQPGSAVQGRRVEPVLGLWGGQQHRTTLLCFAVDE
ncbi:MAG: hypothetical protein ACR2K0_04555 [Acidimicrobiales bacterium]